MHAVNLLTWLTMAFACCATLLGQSSTGGDPESISGQSIIDDRLPAYWREVGVTPSRAATEGEWCRRVYIDLLGRIPRLDELQAFLGNRDRQRRAQLVDELLYSSRYSDEFAGNWADYWQGVLIGRTEGRRENLMSRAGLREYLQQAMRDERSYDAIVHELITARGTSDPDTAAFNGAVNFLMLKVQDKAIAATSKTAQIFLGTRIQCTQCHDHPFNSSTPDNDWSQAQFWGFNSFFRQTVALRRFEPDSRQIDHGELADQDFGGEGSTPEDAEVYFAQRNGILKAAYPTFLDGTPLENRSGYLSDVVRREELSKLILQSPLLEKALVNRMWAYFLGYGFTTPIDDFGPNNPATQPELLEELAAATRQADFDLRLLMKWIVLSKPYALSSQASRGRMQDDPTRGQPPLFARFYLRQMRPEALYASLTTAAGADGAPDRGRWLRQFVTANGNDEGTEASTFNGTIPQTLMMFNGDLVRHATRLTEGGLLSQVLAEPVPLAKQVETLYLAALSRRPTKAEVNVARELMTVRLRTAKPEDNPQATALQDLWWALLNSGEFILVH